MKIRRWWAIPTITALLLAGCSGDDDPADTETGAADGAAESGDAQDQSASGNGDAVAIDVWIAFTDDNRLGFVQDRAAEFTEAHPDYQVNVESFDSYNTVFEQAQLALDGGDPPEIIHFFEAATREALDAVDGEGNPVFKSVTEAIDGRSEILGEPVVLDDVVDAPRNYYTVDGNFYSQPWNTSSTILYGNQTLLDQAGITELPETWDDLEAACEAVMSDTDLDNCITWPNHSWWVEQTMGQMGAVLGNNDNGRSGRATEVELDSQEMVDYLTWWSDMEDSGAYLYTGVQRDWDGTAAAFQAQQVAFLMSSSGDAVGLTEGGEESGYDVVAGPMPYDADYDYEGNLIGGATLWLLNGLEPTAEDGALAFLQYFNNPENAAAWHQASGYIPITQPAVDLLEDEGWFDESPNSRVASEQLAAAADTPAATGVLMGNFVAIRDVITAAVEDILVSDADVAQRLADADAEAQQALDDYELLYGEE